MTVAHVFRPENRLAKILHGLAAETPRTLIEDAEARVASLRELIRAFVSEKVKAIAAYAAMDEDTLFAESRTLGDAAIQVAEVAGAAGLEATGEIARGIFAMVDNLVANGGWHTAAVRVHIDALKLIDHGADGQDAANALILERLRAVRAAVGVPD